MSVGVVAGMVGRVRFCVRGSQHVSNFDSECGFCGCYSDRAGCGESGRPSRKALLRSRRPRLPYDDKEDHAYRVYLGEQHRDYRAFNKNKAAEQQQYFKWRHDHPDHVLFKLEIK
jgi:hypothetical protein